MRFVGVSVLALMVSSSAFGKCRDGKTASADTAGHCCWAGQVWSNEKCIGTPTSCPSGFVADSETQSCVDKRPQSAGRDECGEDMMSVKAGGESHCCYPGQAWSTTRKTCVGMPTKCPSDSVPKNMGPCTGNEGDAPCGETCVGVRMLRNLDREQEQEDALNSSCGKRPSAAAGTIADAAWAAKRVLCGGFAPTLAVELLKDTHPSGKAPRVAAYEVVTNGERVAAVIKLEFAGGMMGTRHTTTVDWVLTSTEHISARVVADTAPFAVDPAHARLLDDYFRYKLFPVVTELLKRPRAVAAQ